MIGIMFNIGERALRSGVVNWLTNDIRVALINKEGSNILNKELMNIKYIKPCVIASKKLIGKSVQRTEFHLILKTDNAIFKELKNDEVYAFLIYCNDYNIPLLYYIQPYDNICVINDNANLVINFNNEIKISF